MLLSTVVKLPAMPSGSSIAGITCMSPIAPFGERALGRPRLSTISTAVTAGIELVLGAVAHDGARDADALGLRELAVDAREDP